jgi:chromosome segregation ATPase
MDPLSITVASGSLARLCTQLSASLYTFVSEARCVDKTVQAFQDEIEDLSKVLNSINTSFNDPTYKEAALKATTEHERLHWENLRKSMNDCQWTLESLVNALKRVKKEDSGFFRRPRKQIRLNMTSAEIVRLQKQIQSYKNTMELSLHMITL